MTYGAASVTAIAAILLWTGGALAQQGSSDRLIVPGERVGPITKSTSESALAAAFGPKNIERIEVNLGEGSTAPGTAVYPNAASTRLEVVWADASRTVPKEVRLTGDSSDWRTTEGITLGTRLKEIERLNGAPFRLAGFAFDYGGTIIDCGRGRLKKLGWVEADGGLQRRQIVLRLDPSVEARTRSEYRQVVGDRVFSSNHPAMQALNPSVYQLIVLF